MSTSQLEANIIYRLTKGDEKALDIFIGHYSQFLFRQAFGVLGSKEMAEEIVSDVFFEIWRQRRDLLKIENLTAWLCKITYRKAVSMVRHETILDVSSGLDSDTLEYFQTPVQSVEEEMVSRQEVEIINDAIESLSPKCRQVFSLAKLEKIPYKEISELLGISVNTINYHVKTALDILKGKLRPGRPPD